jgi:hypothetical protein
MANANTKIGLEKVVRGLRGSLFSALAFSALLLLAVRALSLALLVCMVCVCCIVGFDAVPADLGDGIVTKIENAHFWEIRSGGLSLSVSVVIRQSAMPKDTRCLGQSQF